MFRNVTFYRFPRAVAESIICMTFDGDMQKCLAASPAKPCGPLELQSRGWVTPYGDDSAAMCQMIGKCIHLVLGGEDKILPASVVNDQLRKRLAEIEQSGRLLPSRREIRRMKEDLVHELLPRALCKPYRLAGYLDLQECFLAIDTSSRAAADAFVSQLRAALGSFPALPLSAEMPTRAVLTDWVAGGQRPDWLWMGDECGLREVADNGASAKFQRLDLQCEDLQNHLSAGMQVDRLSLETARRLSFTFGDDLVVRKLKMLDAALDQLESVERKDLRAELDARFALLSGEVRHLFRTLAGPFKFSTVEG